MIDMPTLVLLPYLQHVRSIEHFIITTVEERLVCKIPQVRAEPIFERDSKAVLRAMKDFMWKDPGECFLENVFATGSDKLQ